MNYNFILNIIAFLNKIWILLIIFFVIIFFLIYLIKFGILSVIFVFTYDFHLKYLLYWKQDSTISYLLLSFFRLNLHFLKNMKFKNMIIICIFSSSLFKWSLKQYSLFICQILRFIVFLRVLILNNFFIFQIFVKIFRISFFVNFLHLFLKLI